MHKKNRLSLTVAVITVSLTLVIAANSAAQTPPLWGDLEPGPYAVGFGTVERYDFSRTFRQEKDYFGNPMEGESARPIQLCYWYPAERDAGAPGMVYGEYSFPYPADASFFDFLGEMQARDQGVLFLFLNNTQALVQNSMDMDLYAVRDATPAEGSFPLVIYHGGRRSAYSQNVVMCEYLASHGFIVATSHTIGTAAGDVGETDQDLLTVLRDKEVTAAMARELPGVDVSKLGLLGYGYGSSTALLHMMSNSGIDAMVTLQGDFLSAEGTERLMQSAGYNPPAMQAPWLQLYADNPQMPVELGLVDSLEFSQRYSVQFESTRPTDFTSVALVAAVMAPDTAHAPEIVHRDYALASNLVYRFFNAYLNQDEADLAWFNSDAFEGNVYAGEAVPPTQAQFVNIIQNYSVERAEEVCEQFNLLDPAGPILPSGVFTQIGYQFLQGGNIPSAIAVFRLGVMAFPGSSNGWDSYGEACAANNDLELALANYKKAQELFPADTTLTDAFRLTLEASFTGAIERLETLIAEQTNGSE